MKLWKEGLSTSACTASRQHPSAVGTSTPLTLRMRQAIFLGSGRRMSLLLGAGLRGGVSSMLYSDGAYPCSNDASASSSKPSLLVRSCGELFLRFGSEPAAAASLSARASSSAAARCSAAIRSTLSSSTSARSRSASRSASAASASAFSAFSASCCSQYVSQSTARKRLRV